MKKLIYGVLFFSLVLVLAACSSGSPDSDAGEDDDDKADAPKELKIAGYSNDEHPSTQALHEFAEKIEKESDGRLTAKVYPANQLGDYITVYKEIMQGTIDMGLITTPSETDPRLDLFLIPYMATTYEDVEEIYGEGSFVREKMQEFNNDNGVQMIGAHANGFAGVGTKKKVPNITDPEKDNDLMIRSAVGPIYSEPMKDIGFRVTTIPLSDLSSALQTGAVDGWSGGEASLNYFSYRDMIDNFYTTNDFFNTDAFYMNEELWDGLSEEDADIVKNAADELTENSFETVREFDKLYKEKLEEEGIEVIELSDEEVEVLAEAVREKTYPKLKDEMGEDLINELLEYLDTLK